MKELLILSGKGGTGKTTIAGAFIRLAQARVFADCDVDAPNLHLVTKKMALARYSDYFGLPKAEINPALCSRCALCREHCRFEAIEAGEEYRVNPFACEGCGVCAAICPAKAITMKPAAAGQLKLYVEEDNDHHDNDDAVFSTAQLKMGSGTSGKLVTEVKKQMTAAAVTYLAAPLPETELAIIDGSPGIGCPVIASLSGVNLALLVAEPSLSGLSDLKRIIETARKLQTRVAVCINKYDTNPEIAQKIEALCQKMALPFVGRIPFDPQTVKAINNGQSIIEFDCPAGRAVSEVYTKTMELLH